MKIPYFAVNYLLLIGTLLVQSALADDRIILFPNPFEAHELPIQSYYSGHKDDGFSEAMREVKYSDLAYEGSPFVEKLLIERGIVSEGKRVFSFRNYKVGPDILAQDRERDGRPHEYGELYKIVEKMISILVKKDVDPVFYPNLKEIRFVDTIDINQKKNCEELTRWDIKSNLNCDDPTLIEVLYLPMDNPMLWISFFDQSMNKDLKYLSRLSAKISIIQEKHNQEVEAELKEAPVSCEQDNGEVRGLFSLIGLFGEVLAAGGEVAEETIKIKEVTGHIFKSSINIFVSSGVLSNELANTLSKSEIIHEILNPDLTSAHLRTLGKLVETGKLTSEVVVPSVRNFVSFGEKFITETNESPSIFEVLAAYFRYSMQLTEEDRERLGACIVTVLTVKRFGEEED